MVKKVGPRLRELILAAKGSQSTVQRNLGTAFFSIAVQGDKRKVVRDQLSIQGPFCNHSGPDLELFGIIPQQLLP